MGQKKMHRKKSIQVFGNEDDQKKGSKRKKTEKGGTLKNLPNMDIEEEKEWISQTVFWVEKIIFE